MISAEPCVQIRQLAQAEAVDRVRRRLERRLRVSSIKSLKLMANSEWN